MGKSPLGGGHSMGGGAQTVDRVLKRKKGEKTTGRGEVFKE